MGGRGSRRKFRPWILSDPQAPGRDSNPSRRDLRTLSPIPPPFGWATACCSLGWLRIVHFASHSVPELKICALRPPAVII